MTVDNPVFADGQISSFGREPRDCPARLTAKRSMSILSIMTLLSPNQASRTQRNRTEQAILKRKALLIGTVVADCLLFLLIAPLSEL